jgi:DNA-binding MarR family transcriptional regulator
MSHVYSNTTPAKPFDSRGWIKQVYDSELDTFERQVLALMATYASNERTLPFKAFNGQTIGQKLKLSSSTVGRVLQRLKKAKLLTKRTQKARTHWVLPSEDQVAAFNPKRK